MKKTLIVLVILGLAGLLGWKITGKVMEKRASDAAGGKRGGGKSAAVAVETRALKRADIRDVRTFTGSLVADSLFEVAPKVAGRLESLLVEIGDTVKSGDLIAKIDDAEYVEEVERARAELNVAKANVDEAVSNLETARRELQRVERLRKKDIATDQDLDTARGEFRTQEARHKVSLAGVARMESDLKAAQVRLSYTRISAQWDESDPKRIVGERFVDEGTMLTANAPIVSIIDLDPMIAVINVIERDYALLRIGQEAILTTDARPGEEFIGKVVRIAPLLRETSRQARVEIETPNPEWKLRPGMFVRARIEFAEHKNALLAPTEAVTRREKLHGLFVVERGEATTARFVPVKTGIEHKGWIEILSPEVKGDVVTLGQHLLSDGMEIRLPSPPTATPATETGDKQ